jgi:hypothetical protein
MQKSPSIPSTYSCSHGNCWSRGSGGHLVELAGGQGRSYTHSCPPSTMSPGTFPCSQCLRCTPRRTSWLFHARLWTLATWIGMVPDGLRRWPHGPADPPAHAPIRHSLAQDSHAHHSATFASACPTGLTCPPQRHIRICLPDVPLRLHLQPGHPHLHHFHFRHPPLYHRVSSTFTPCAATGIITRRRRTSFAGGSGGCRHGAPQPFDANYSWRASQLAYSYDFKAAFTPTLPVTSTCGQHCLDILFHIGFNPMTGWRIGEAANPGPSDGAQRERMRHLLGQMHLLPQHASLGHPAAPPQDDANQPEEQAGQEPYNQIANARRCPSEPDTVSCEPDIPASLSRPASSVSLPSTASLETCLAASVPTCTSPTLLDPRLHQPGASTQAAFGQSLEMQDTAAAPPSPPPATLPPSLPPPQPEPQPPAHSATSFRLPVPINGAAAQAARTAVQVARNIGAVPVGASLPEAAQRTLNRQRWSAFLCPLMWAATDTVITDGVLQWLTEGLRGAPLEADIGGQRVHGPRVAREAWLALREAMRNNGINSREDLCTWLARQRVEQTHIDAYLQREVQEFIIGHMAGCQRGRLASLHCSCLPPFGQALG